MDIKNDKGKKKEEEILNNIVLFFLRDQLMNEKFFDTKMMCLDILFSIKIIHTHPECMLVYEYSMSVRRCVTEERNGKRKELL